MFKHLWVERGMLSGLTPKIIYFCQCAEITHCLTAKYPIAVSKKRYRGLLRVNQKRKVLDVCVVSTVEFLLVANGLRIALSRLIGSSIRCAHPPHV